ESTAKEIEALEQRIYQLAGEQFNIDSPKQLGHILFEVLELPHGKKTQRGYSTDAQVLKKLSDVHELPAEVLHYREFAKMKSTYIDALPRIAASFGDGRVHTTFNETVTSTGRLSSSDPNLQNIPVRTDFGRRIRACFGALDENSMFMSADYSQIELRLLAHLSADEHLVAAFNSGADFHASTASRVFGVPVEEVTPQMRSRAKAVNFGIVYGQQAFGLAQSLGIPMGEARDMIDRYFEAYPGVRSYLDEAVEAAKDRGYAETMLGRKRHSPELRAKNAVQRGFGERTAMNHPMQGSAADIIKMAMNEVARRMLAEGFKSKLLLQVHDELDFSVPVDEIEALSAMVKDVMEHVVELRVPLIADVSVAKTWAEAH
ncbi:MAG: DNA polymerase I, partial [Eggerthellaceae bacterium]|nr:DNA polymerase I [Eggerthellaceae bacterium]